MTMLFQLPRAFALSIGLGPVGSFISAGRRSRDLWWGSTWLAECTAHVASSLREIGRAKGYEVTLLLPSQARLVALGNAERKRDGSLRAFHGRVSNHVRAKVEVTCTTNDSLHAIVAEVEGRAHRWLSDKVKACLDGAKKRLSKERSTRELDISKILIPDRFEAQLEAIEEGDFIQFSAGWTLLDDVHEPGPALHRADELMMAARRTRTFRAASWSSPGLRKSDLDAGRDGVLRESANELAHRIRAALGIGRGEQLDALGFTRRIAAFEHEKNDAEIGRLPFPPITRIAIEPWIDRVQQSKMAKDALKDLKKYLSSQLNGDRTTFLTWCTPACDPTKVLDDEEAPIFPFDAGILLENGISTALELVKDIQGAPPMIRGASHHVEALHRALGVPAPYYALIEADGDGVGSALAAADADPSHVRSARYQELVQRLDAYADGLDAKLRPMYGARAFYVGGDDALVLVPLDRLTNVMRTMSEHFSTCMQHEPGFTLTFGVVVAHVKDDLRWVRRQASSAIKSAKRQRAKDRPKLEQEWSPSGWAEIREQPRSGALRSCSGAVPGLLDDIDAFVEAITDGRLSQRTPQLMLEHGTLVRGRPPRNPEDERLALAARELACHRARAQLERSDKQSAHAAIDRALTEARGDPWDSVVDLAARMKLAARIASAKGDR